MFCYTYLTGLECGLRELVLWSEISSQHPIFFTNVANCLNINLDPSIVAGLNRIEECFNFINQEARRLLAMAGNHRNNMMYNYSLAQETARLMQLFLQNNQEFLAIIQQLKNYGKDQPVWQILVGHIENEQVYMNGLITTLLQQIMQMSSHQPGMMPPRP